MPRTDGGNANRFLTGEAVGTASNRDGSVVRPRRGRRLGADAGGGGRGVLTIEGYWAIIWTAIGRRFN